MKGKIIDIHNLYIKDLKRYRTARIYLPIDYEHSTKSYPVLYMFDGQSIFDYNNDEDKKSWKINTTLDELTEKKLIDNIIVASLECQHGLEGILRLNEYTPWKNYHIIDLINWIDVSYFNYLGGEGDFILDYYINDFKNLIDSNFRTLSDRNNTFIGGSSMGGLMSLYSLLKYQNVFSKACVFSPAFWFSEEMFSWVENQEINNNLKIYMDIGTNETSNDEIIEFPKIYLDSANKMNDILINKGFNESNYMYKIIEGGEHNKDNWALRFPNMIKWLLD